MSSGLKVLWFTNTPASGLEHLQSASTIGGGWLSSLDKALSNEVDLHVVFYYPKFAKNFIHQNVNYYPICKKNWRLEMLKNILYTSEIDEQHLNIYLDIIRRIKPDIIHIHGTENSFGCIIDKIPIPVIVSIQGNISVIHHKFFCGIEEKYADAKQYNTLRNAVISTSFKKLYNKFYKLKTIEQKNLNYAKYIIGRTAWDYRISRILASNSQYFHNDEILRTVFYENQWNPNFYSSKIILHTTNSNSIIKGFETLSYSLYLLQKKGLNIEWRVAGISESDTIVKIVKRKLKDKYPKSGIVLLGPLNETSLCNKLLEANAYVMPSHIENSPNNLCEAMILGMPCIATFAGGTGSMLKDGEEGILIQDGDPWAMAGAIIELSENHDKAIEYGKNARIISLKRHDKNRIVDGLIKIYAEVIKSTNENLHNS